MLSLYIVLGVIGGGLIVLSALGVIGHEVGHDVDLSHDLAVHDAGNVDHVLHDTGDVWLPFLSLRFWIYASAAFGLVGMLSTWFSGAGPGMVFFTSLMTGLLVGFLAAWAYRMLSRSEVQGGVGTGDFVGAIAKVMVPVGEEKTGKVRMMIKGDTIDMLALAESGQFEVGDEVLVTGVEGEKVMIVKKEEYLGD